MDAAKVILRSFAETDKNFILSTWLKGQRFGSFYYSEVPQDLYFREYGEILKRTLALPGIEIIIACDEDKPAWIWGFAVVRRETLYWVHVKGDYRAQGIATLMLKDRGITTFKAFTRIGRAIAAKKGLIFNPF